MYVEGRRNQGMGEMLMAYQDFGRYVNFIPILGPGGQITPTTLLFFSPPGYLELPTALVRMLPAWLNCTKNFSTSEKSNYLCGNLIFCFSMIRNQHIFFISLFFILYPPRLLIWPVANHNKVEALCSARVRGWTNWVGDNLDNFFWSSNLDVRCPSCHIPPLIICFKGPIKIPLTVNLYSLKFWCCFSPPKCTQITSLVLITLLIT